MYGMQKRLASLFHQDTGEKLQHLCHKQKHLLPILKAIWGHSVPKLWLKLKPALPAERPVYIL